MSSLASLLPAFLKRKRSPEEEEQRMLRAALNVLSRSTVVDACIKLYEANVAHKQRIGELEQAVARSGAVEHNNRAWMRDDLATYAPLAPTIVTTETDAPTLRDRMLSLQPVQLHREASNFFAISSHEPEAAYWRKSDVSYKSPHFRGEEQISFWNLRAADIDVLWINFDGDDARFPSSTVSACSCDAAISWLLHALLTAAAVPAGQARPVGVFLHAAAPRVAHMRLQNR